MISRFQQHWSSRYWHHSYYYCWSSYSRHDFPSWCWSCSRYSIILSLAFKVKCLSSAICKELQSILINYCGVLRSYYSLSLSLSPKFVWTLFVCLFVWGGRKEDRSGPTATNIWVLERAFAVGFSLPICAAAVGKSFSFPRLCSW